MDNHHSFVCAVCGNTDIHSIGILNGKPYCRRCISFRGKEVEHKPSYPKKAPIHLEYELSPEQKELSDKLVENYKKGIDSLVYAVCGSGKTEIVLQIIQYALNCGEIVAFALPRKDVCIELSNRLKHIFSRNKVISVYGGHTKEKTGDIIVLTTHQLYRYKYYFNLIILDEIDAFPFKGNKILESMFFDSLNGHYVLMSATPSKDVINHFSKEGKDILKLQTRFHKHPLPVPMFIKGPTPYLFLYLLKKISRYKSEKKQLFIFAPTIEECESLFSKIKLFFKDGNCVHSKKKNRNEIIDAFRMKTYLYLVTTSVLERGITMPNLQVIIYKSHKNLYDSGTLIQISGRVGRKAIAPEGEVIFLANKITQDMKEARDEIIRNNRVLQDMLFKDQ